jgi:dCMP deaminase
VAAELSRRLNIPVYKPLVQDGLYTDRSYIYGHDAGSSDLAILLADRVDMIFDRTFVSEAVYSRVYNRVFQRDIPDAVYDSYDSRMSKVPHIAFLFDGISDLESTFDIVRSRGVDDILQPQWEDIVKGYRAYMARSAMNWKLVQTGNDVLGMVESAIRAIVLERETFNPIDHVYMGMAMLAARRSTCLSRRTGAVLLSATGHVISVGYNGAPTGFPHPVFCERMHTESGSDLEKCDDCHAEENCIIHAAKSGADPTGGTIYTVASPCRRCARMLINAGITTVVYRTPYDDSALMMLKRTMEVRQI